MMQKMNRFVDKLSEFFAHRKGLLPSAGLLFLVLNFALQLAPATWLSQTNCFLHLGLFLAIIGFMLAWAL